jgi:hypothetical protein
MKIISEDAESACLQLDSQELLSIVGALNEVCFGIQIGEVEFETRIGVPKLLVEGLLDSILDVYKRVTAQ